MGQVADGVLANGGEAVGIMPVDLFKMKSDTPD